MSTRELMSGRCGETISLMSTSATSCVWPNINIVSDRRRRRRRPSFTEIAAKTNKQKMNKKYFEYEEKYNFHQYYYINKFIKI